MCYDVIKKALNPLILYFCIQALFNQAPIVHMRAYAGFVQFRLLYNNHKSQDQYTLTGWNNLPSGQNDPRNGQNYLTSGQNVVPNKFIKSTDIVIYCKQPMYEAVKEVFFNFIHFNFIHVLVEVNFFKTSSIYIGKNC